MKLLRHSSYPVEISLKSREMITRIYSCIFLLYFYFCFAFNQVSDLVSALSTVITP